VIVSNVVLYVLYLDMFDIFSLVVFLVTYVSGKRSAYVRYHVRPHETYREANRRFFDCEVVRSPVCQQVDIDSILGICCVLDLATYSLVCISSCRVYCQRSLCLSLSSCILSVSVSLPKFRDCCILICIVWPFVPVNVTHEYVQKLT